MATVFSPEDAPGTPEKSPGETPVSTPTDNRRRESKPGRKSIFAGTEDLIIAQEVFASQAYVAPHEETLSRFETAALDANANPNFAHKVTGKHIQDRFKKLLDEYAKRNGQDSVLFGVGGEIRELDELLGDIIEAKRDLGARKDGDMKERADQERQKIAAGQDVVLNALRGKQRREQKISSDEESLSKKRRLAVGDGMQSIGLTLRESEAASFDMEQKKLDFAREKATHKLDQSEKDRKERAEERAQRATELAAYRDSMSGMMEQTGKQMQSVFSLVTTLHSQQQTKKTNE